MEDETIRTMLQKSGIDRVKVLFVPFIIVGGEYHFMMLKDREHNEWTFLSGGCRHADTYPDVCLYREVREETKGIFNGRDLAGIVKPFKYFTMMGSSQSTRKFRTLYYIYPVQIRGDKTTMLHLEQKFRDTEARFKSQAENTDLRFMSISEMKKVKVWNFIIKLMGDSTFRQQVRNPDVPMVDIKL